MKPLVSIIISNFNKEKFLFNCLKSCFKQNYKNFEVIIVDNESNDNSIKIIKKFKKIKLISKKKTYTSPALNQLNSIIQGIKISKGKIICLLDSDDYFKKNKLETVVNFFKKNYNEKLICDIPINKFRNKNIIFKYKKNRQLYKIWPTTFPTSSISFRKNFYNEIKKNLFQKKYDKLEIDFRLCVLANIYFEKLSILNKNLTFYTQNTGGIMSQYSKFSLSWWIKRNQAHQYFSHILKKNNIKHIKSLDYLVTNTIFWGNYYINSLFTKNKKSNI